jgi:pimeloyl-ACP methyl ester carboxylesterase
MKATVATVTSRDGTEIAFDRVGEGPPVVLVGGALNDRTTPPLVELAGHLTSGFTVYTYDRRGRGASGDAPSYAVVREVEDLEALIDEAGGSASVYGLSSGAVLALEAAARGGDIARLALFEPPLTSGDTSDTADEQARVAELIAAGRRGDAVEEFLRGIGLPDEALAGIREWPGWPGMEAMAHTILYDAAITEDRSLMTDRLPSVTTPTLVLGSDSSDAFLQGAAKAVAVALPNGELRLLSGGFHDVPAEEIASALGEFFRDDRG